MPATKKSMNNDFQKIHQDSINRLVRCARVNTNSWLWCIIVLIVLCSWITSEGEYPYLEHICYWLMGLTTGWVAALWAQVLVLKYGKGQ